MIVVYRQGNSQELTYFFGVNNQTELPFVDSTLGEVSISGWKAVSDKVIFYIPENWTHFDDGSGSFVVYNDITAIKLNEEMTVFTDVGTLPLNMPSVHDLAPKEVIKNGDLLIGHGFKTMKEMLTCKALTSSPELSFIEYSLEGLADTILATSGSSKDIIGESYILSGKAFVDEDSELIGDCKIYGPCIIVNSVLTNSTIYPGSVIINSRVSNSFIETTYLQNSGVSNSSMEKSVAFHSFIDNTRIVSGRLPRLTTINGGNEEKRHR